ncbi:isocitrate/isopropylmalate dehydrogenase family protein [Candidatus Fermentibacterales bacterium]|nr:isocitrate/isopropylmalate dehydrogenase family protein [Candidatus Fermentibacterales bacterium]
MKRTVVTMPGDGIGNAVMKEGLKVLDAVGFKAGYVHADIGWELWKTEGNPLPDRTIDLLKKHRTALFGSITSKPKDKAAEELDPSLRGKGCVYYSPIVGMRQLFDLDVCVRPCRTFPGNPLNFIRRSRDGGFEEPVIDAVIFRQNTEGLYGGVEWTDPPQNVWDALNTHPRFELFRAAPREDLAVSTRIFTRRACRRILQAAFEHARKFGYGSVTICEKPNVIRETSGMMREEGKKLASAFPGIELWETNIDAQMMWLTKNPEDYGVIVSGNMFGDIVSDGYAGLVGGLGFACSANIGETVAVFEPTHGSAPKYADFPTSIVNPIAMILSCAMMLDHVGETAMGERVREAVARVVAAGRVRTYDMLKLRGCPEVLEQGAASTEQMGDAVVRALEDRE